MSGNTPGEDQKPSWGVITAVEVSPEFTSDEDVPRIVDLARKYLDMDVVFLSEFTGGRQIFRAIAGDAASFGLELDDGPDLAATYCQRLVRGVIPSVVPDASDEIELCDLPATATSQIGAYVGVPIHIDGEVYGTFCCLSHSPHQDLRERDARFMELLAELLAPRLRRAREARRARSEIEAVLDAGQLTIALQPIYRVMDNAIAGFEAFSRFEALGLTPDVAFREAHGAGLGIELELLAIGHALDVHRLLPADTHLSVNVSPATVQSFEFLGAMGSIELPANLVMELTEHESIADYSPVVERLALLRHRQVQIAIDDVGAGYASLRHVLQLHPEVLKIDQSITLGAATDRARRLVITNIVLLALDLDAVVVAEGVETQDDLQAVTDCGVDMAQGYLLGRPTTDRGIWATWGIRQHCSGAPAAG